MPLSDELRYPCEHGWYDAHPAMGGIWRCNGGKAPSAEKLIEIVDAMDGVQVYVRGQGGYDREKDAWTHGFQRSGIEGTSEYCVFRHPDGSECGQPKWGHLEAIWQ